MSIHEQRLDGPARTAAVMATGRPRTAGRSSPVPSGTSRPCRAWSSSRCASSAPPCRGTPWPRASTRWKPPPHPDVGVRNCTGKPSTQRVGAHRPSRSLPEPPGPRWPRSPWATPANADGRGAGPSNRPHSQSPAGPPANARPGGRRRRSLGRARSSRLSGATLRSGSAGGDLSPRSGRQCPPSGPEPAPARPAQKPSAARRSSPTRCGRPGERTTPEPRCGSGPPRHR